MENIGNKIEEKEERDLKKMYESEKHLAREPFFFEGTNGKGVLLVHGWTSTPYEVRKLGEFLNGKGFTVSGIKLKGHCQNPEDLENVKWQEWMDDLENGFRELKEKCEKVYLGGTSLGGILSIIFAEKKPEVSGLVLMATPYKLKLDWLVKLVSRLSLLFGKRYWDKYYPKSFGSSGLVTRLVSYQKYPTANGIESHKAIEEARKKLPGITCPCFVLQSTNDHMVIPESADMILESVRACIKRKKMIEKAYHTFIADINNEHVFQDIFEFLENN